ncbi:MAG TPA: hypothetical protein VFP42_12420 [Acidimicrobiia bacterium]|nr:hypothetical protein [Acidimicrobiia bacterium]
MTDDFEFGDEFERPLIPDDLGGPPEDLVFDETGTLGPQLLRPVTEVIKRPEFEIGWKWPCGLGVLDGSWNLEIASRFQARLGTLRGPMRIEAADGVLRVSGDAYYSTPGFLLERTDAPSPPTAAASFIPHWKRNWYPHYPFNEYVWYFRSTGASYVNGQLYFPFTRHLWNKTTQEFVSTDTGWMSFSCTSQLSRASWLLQPTVKMDGQAMIGGQPHTITATKTSPYYRGLVVEVDVMTNRTWPNTGAGHTFTGTFRGDGIDVRMYINETNVPEDNTLTDSECHALMAAHRSISSIGYTWRLWTLVGSRRSGSNTFGLMFDVSTPEREGCVSYSDATFDSSTLLEPVVRGARLGDVPLGHLRTLIHEVGHCLNLYHPKADDHNPPIGETIMNQTGDVISFASPGNLYPSNAEFRFNDHNRTSLIHSPDPQIAPGWKPFGWGHASPNLGVPAPTDATGLRETDRVGEVLEVKLDISEVAAVGEFLTATVSVTNRGPETVTVNRSLNLAEGNLEVTVHTPEGDDIVVRDVVHLCGPERTADLGPGETIESVVQLFYTSSGFTFSKAGSYELRAVFSPRRGSPLRLTSNPQQVTIHAPTSQEESDLADLTMDHDVGLSFGFGDFGGNTEAAEKLKRLSADFTETDTGTAAALVLANSYSRPFRDLGEGQVVRKSSTRDAEAAIDQAMTGTNADRVAEICTAVVAASDTEAPVLGLVREELASDKKTRGGKSASQRADDILADYVGDN